jgi:chromosomal replication initiator protein
MYNAASSNDKGHTPYPSHRAIVRSKPLPAIGTPHDGEPEADQEPASAEPVQHPLADALAARGNRNGDARFDPHALWQAVLGELEVQMPSATFNTWVRDTWVLGYEDGDFIIGLPNAYARDWLENRLRYKIKRILTTMMQRQAQVTFQVAPRQVSDSHGADKPAPLYDGFAEPIVEPVAETLVDPVAELPVPPRTLREPARVHSTPYNTLGGVQLNSNHTFDTFVVGNNNRLAHAAATAVAEKPGQTFNPLFIYGGVGLGKTHLLHAIGNHAHALGLLVLYCSSEQFTNDLIGAIRSQTTEQFRNKYREVDILLIDDIQFIGGKESTQEEFFHTFNHLHAAGRQVVLSSDRPPKALATLEERLRSRFEGGLQTDISQPDFETRVAILQAKASRLGLPIDPGVLMLVAERVDSNIRELEGALNRLALHARLARTALTIAMAMSVLDDLTPLRTACPPHEVVRIVAGYFRLQATDLTGRRRTQEIALARQVAMYLLSEEHDLSLSAIGDHLGGRDHSTIRYGVDQVAAGLERDEQLRNDIMALRDLIYVSAAR